MPRQTMTDDALIAWLRAEHEAGHAPSQMDVALHFDIPPGSVFKRLAALKEAGRLDWPRQQFSRLTFLQEVRRVRRERDKPRKYCSVEHCRAERLPGNQWCAVHVAAFRRYGRKLS